MNNESKGRTKWVELLKPHTHEGREYEPPAKLELSEADANWLISIESAKEAKAPKSDAPGA